MSPERKMEAYQLHIWIREISPMIWRRLQVSGDSTIADLHHYIQTAMGWSDIYLHQFKIYGKTYGITHTGGVSFRDDANTVFLKDFRFQVKERFIYQYNFFDNWEVQIRVEKILPANLKKGYPKCIGGSRAGPPEDCGGACAFMQLENHYSPWEIQEQLIKVLKNNNFEEEVDLQELMY